MSEFIHYFMAALAHENAKDIPTADQCSFQIQLSKKININLEACFISILVEVK